MRRRPLATGTASITLRTAAAGGYVKLEVSDTGGGIGPDAQAKVFDPFFTTKPTGNGLGLTVVHRIVRGARGSVRFETELGRGTKFSVRLPATTYAAAPVGPLAASWAGGRMERRRNRPGRGG